MIGDLTDSHRRHLQEVVALTRPASVSKPQLLELQNKGVKVLQCDLNAPEKELADALTGIDVVISSVGPADQLSQIKIATAAKAAGVKRFVPCGFITACPPGGIMWLRDEVGRFSRVGPVAG
jgi:putative NADH-flavin reductase